MNGVCLTARSSESNSSVPNLLASKLQEVLNELIQAENIIRASLAASATCHAVPLEAEVITLPANIKESGTGSIYSTSICQPRQVAAGASQPRRIPSGWNPRRKQPPSNGMCLEPKSDTLLQASPPFSPQRPNTVTSDKPQPPGIVPCSLTSTTSASEPTLRNFPYDQGQPEIAIPSTELSNWIGASDSLRKESLEPQKETRLPTEDSAWTSSTSIKTKGNNLGEAWTNDGEASPRRDTVSLMDQCHHYSHGHKNPIALEKELEALGHELEAQGKVKIRHTIRPTVYGGAVNQEEVKGDFAEAFRKMNYDVACYYKATGWAQLIARNHIFENLTLFVITINAIWLGFEVDVNKSDFLFEADPSIQLVEYLFTMYFSGEWIIRFCAFQYKRNIFRDFWMNFDLFLASLMVADTWIVNAVLAFLQTDSAGIGLRQTTFFKIFRLVRLTRLTRAVKLMQCVPEMMVMLKGMAAATRALSITMIFLLAAVYIAALALRQASKGTEVESQYCSSVIDGIYTFLILGLFPDWHDTITDLNSTSVVYGIAFIIIEVFIALTFMNMLVGVLVEVVKVASTVEQENLDVAFLSNVILTCMREIGVSAADNEIFDKANIPLTRSEFECVINDFNVIKTLMQMRIDVLAVFDYLDLMYPTPRDTCSFGFLLEILLNLRQGHAARVKDILDMKRQLKSQIQCLEKEVRRCTGVFGQLASKASMDMAPLHLLASATTTSDSK